MDSDKPIDFQKKKIAILEKRKHQHEHDIVICYIQGIDPNGEKVFSYIAIDAELLEQFNTAVHQGNVDVDEYGYRIVSGYGEPSEAVKNMMMEEYGFDHESAAVQHPKPSNDA